MYGAIVAGRVRSVWKRMSEGDVDAPVRMVTAPHTPVPFSPALEDRYVPDARRVVEAVRSIV